MVDLLLSPDFDLMIANGDFANGESSAQNQHLLLITEAGSLKSQPSTGVGIGSFINDDQATETLKKKIQQEYELDGLSISSLKVNTLNDIEIKAAYQ